MINVLIEHAEFKWIDLVNPTLEELQTVGRQYAIHLTSIQDCLQPEHLPKYEKIGDIVFLIVRAYDENALPKANNMRDLTRKVAIFIGKHFLITVHRVDQNFMLPLREHWQHDQTTIEEKKQFHILSDLLQAVLESYEKPLNEAEGMLEEFENKIFLHRNSVKFQELYILRRKTVVYQRMIHLLKDVLLKLNFITDHQSPYLQNLREEAERLQFITDQLADNVNHLLGLYLALQSHRTNEIMRVLTLFSVFFMPLTFLVGIYGMNFDFMPELKWKYGYPLVLLFMATISLILFWWFKQRKFLK